MALNFTVSYAFSPNTTISSSQVNTNTNDVANVFTGLEAGTKTLALLKMDAVPATGSEVATKTYTDRHLGWRRPNLTFATVALVDVEVNTGTANTTSILFPDGDLRTVTEDTSATNVYRRFDITATASFISGTEDSGLYSGLSEATNTWYAIYAVKSQINSAKFVLVGTTTLPTQGNFATLNTNLGTSGWVYLGLIANGDNSGATGDIVNFVQAAGETFFKNTCASGTMNLTGLRFATTAGAGNLTWTYAAGTAINSAQLPNSVSFVNVIVSVGANTDKTTFIENSGAGYSYAAYENTLGTSMNVRVPAANGVQAALSAGTPKIDIHIAGFVDLILSGGANVLI